MIKSSETMYFVFSYLNLLFSGHEQGLSSIKMAALPQDSRSIPHLHNDSQQSVASFLGIIWAFLASTASVHSHSIET